MGEFYGKRRKISNRSGNDYVYYNLYTYSQKSYVFWAFFVIDRLMNLHYEAYIESSLLAMLDEELKWPILILTLLFLVLSIGIFLYTPFKYPKLFGILVLGELIDGALKVIKDKL